MKEYKKVLLWGIIPAYIEVERPATVADHFNEAIQLIAGFIFFGILFGLFALAFLAR